MAKLRAIVLRARRARPALALLLALFACGTTANEATTLSPVPASVERGVALLDRVPADTPFLWWSPGDKTSPETIEKALAFVFAGIGDDLPVAAGFLSSLGDGRPFVIHGLGAHSAMRVELESPQAAIEAAGALASELSVGGASRETFEGRPYWLVSQPDAVVIVAADGQQLSAAQVPLALKAAAVPVVVGATAPTRSIEAAGLRAELRARHGLREAFMVINVSAYLDAELGLRQRFGVISAQFVNGPAVDRRCADGSQTFARSFPRLVAGFRQRDASGFSVMLALESDPRLASTLAALRVPAPAAHATDAGLTLTFAVNINGLANLARGVLAVLEPCAERLPVVADVVAAITDAESTWSPARGVGLVMQTAGHVIDPYMRGMLVSFTSDPEAMRGMFSRYLGVELPAIGSPRYPLRETTESPAPATVFLDIGSRAAGYSIGPTSSSPLRALMRSRSRRESFVTIRGRRETVKGLDLPISLGDVFEFDVSQTQHGVVVELEMTGN